MLIAEVEFVRQKQWALLPLWADTCPAEAASALANRREISRMVVDELEILFRSEMKRNEGTSFEGTSFVRHEKNGKVATNLRPKGYQIVPKVVL